ncbi:hypothetical protein SmJEL517_g05792 [Synchytrium microbalum]|uniref:Uncharacterized protein n=1 Tax=Synchytrium microbalum TaxID=1806994 RepID=A0A507BUP0_9FUNG|nr:uncharacterized protein SmJEL517_g05792 [Synchytrium microbalum]TPX30709.1 hypothetical protein SmJEL517_g05792 [Synchytrium microbalum]
MFASRALSSARVASAVQVSPSRLVARVVASGALSQRIHTTSVARSVPTLDSDPWQTSKKFHRPISPHMTIYEPQITWYGSIIHRITGAGLAAGFYGGAIWYGIAPFDSAVLISAIYSLPSPVIVFGKLALVVPFVYHSLNGIRHLIWDTGVGYDNKTVIVTGWTVVGLTAVVSAAFFFMYTSANYRQPELGAPLSASSRTRGNSSSSAFYCVGVFSGMWESLPWNRLPSRTMLAGYISGALFALGWWIFIDGLAFCSTRDPALPVPIAFEDWVPGILSTIALIVVNLIDKEKLNADDFSYSGSNVACKARLFAFVGVTMALGSLGGALAIMSLKYAMPGYSGNDFYFGLTVVLQNFLIFFGSMLLWFGRNSSENEYAPF